MVVLKSSMSVTNSLTIVRKFECGLPYHDVGSICFATAVNSAVYQDNVTQFINSMLGDDKRGCWLQQDGHKSHKTMHLTYRLLGVRIISKGFYPVAIYNREFVKHFVKLDILKMNGG